MCGCAPFGPSRDWPRAGLRTLSRWWTLRVCTHARPQFITPFAGLPALLRSVPSAQPCTSAGSDRAANSACFSRQRLMGGQQQLTAAAACVDLRRLIAQVITADSSHQTSAAWDAGLESRILRRRPSEGVASAARVVAVSRRQLRCNCHTFHFMGCSVAWAPSRVCGGSLLDAWV
jgi:hypothetical protein